MSVMTCKACITMRVLACVFCLTAIVAADDPIEPSIDNPLYTSIVLDKLEAKVDSLGKESIARMVPSLTKLLERHEPTLDWRILRFLTKADLTAIHEPQPVVDSVSRLLNAPEQATRALAVDVLCAIGEPAYATLVTNLKSSSPRMRAGSVAVLTRQGVLTESDAIGLCVDTDARVRFAAIKALGKTQEGINVLIAMLADVEPAVACGAADQLGRLPEKNDSEKIVRALANSLTRPEVSVFAARSLARMGSDARSAIPKLLAAYPVGGAENFFASDMVQLALLHIGEPREEDIDEIVILLENGDTEQRILVCQTLARLGTKAKATSAILENMMRLDLARDKNQYDEHARGNDEHQRFSIAADAALIAHWFTTRNAIKFRSLAEEWPDELWLGMDFWEEVSETERSDLIACLLQSSKPVVVAEALNAIVDGQPMPLLETKIQDMMKAGSIENDVLLANAWLNTLISTQPNVEDRVLAALEHKSISIEQFARHARRLNFRSQQSLRFLLEGARNLEEYRAQECGEAYIQLAPNRLQAIEELMSQGNFGHDRLLRLIAKEKWDSHEFNTMAEAAIQSTDYWTRVYGIEILGNIGAASSKTVTEIKSLFEKALSEDRQEISDTTIAAAVALFKIEGDFTFIDRLLVHIDQLHSNHIRSTVYHDYKRQELLQEIVAPGSQYTDMIVARLNAYDPINVAEIEDNRQVVDAWLRLAMRTKSQKARDCVVRFSMSKDALLSSLARERLENEN